VAVGLPALSALKLKPGRLTQLRLEGLLAPSVVMFAGQTVLTGGLSRV
jgi:hypothetical protein